jgi:hypothetical protein
MQEEMNTKIEIPESLLSIFQEMAVSPVDLLKNHALNVIKGKIVRYTAEDRSFREKYACDFDDFKARTSGMMNEENFEWEDDLMDWEFAVTNLRLWQQKERAIQRQ